MRQMKFLVILAILIFTAQPADSNSEPAQDEKPNYEVVQWGR